MCSVQFKEALQSVGATATTKLYPDKTHTDLFLQVCELLFINVWSLMQYSGEDASALGDACD